MTDYKGMIFDTHTHYDDEAFDADREDILSGLYSHGIGLAAGIGVDVDTCKKTLELAEKYDFLYAVLGFHPSDVLGMDGPEFDWLKDTISTELRKRNDINKSDKAGWDADGNTPVSHRGTKLVAIGEIGLDYHWAKEDKEHITQQKWLRDQIALAKEASLPIVIHSRDAAADTMRILKEENAGINGGIIHCYSYSPDQAVEYVKMGFDIGVGGVVTFKNSRRLKETVEVIPLGHIVLETDCPYMAPEPYRGKRNDSTYLPYVVDAIAAIKGIDRQTVIDRTTENAMRVYRL